jgi:hypothetical protein
MDCDEVKSQNICHENGNKMEVVEVKSENEMS